MVWLSLLKYWKEISIGIAVVFLVGLLWYAKRQYDEGVLKDFRLAQQELVIQSMKRQKIVDDFTIHQLEEAKQKAEEEAHLLNERLKDIDEAPDEDDGPVAPVLKRAIDSLHHSK
jgi:uncharacterized membrane protein YhfC